jgi:hypothetical protein
MEQTMNPLVASVIRTLVPVAVGQVASWLLLLNVTLPSSAQEGLGAFLGGLLTAIYYVGVRVIEQQWPQFGLLLGLTASPDTYSKGDPAATTAPAATTPADVPAVAEATLSLNDVAPASTFPSAAVDAALAAPEPVTVTPVFTPPAA